MRGPVLAARRVLTAACCLLHAAPCWAEETGQVLAMGGAGTALSGRPDAYLSNPAHLAGLDRWSMATGFVAGSLVVSRPGMTRENRPSGFWSSLSEAALLAPLPSGINLAGFVTHIGGSSQFRTEYQSDVPAGAVTLQNTGILMDDKSGAWFRGLAAGVKLGLDAGIGLALGHVEIKSESFQAFEYYVRDYPGVGFVNTTSQSFERRRKGGSFAGLLGGTYRMKRAFSAGAVLVLVTPSKVKESYSSLFNSDSEPNHPFDETRFLEGEATLKTEFPFEADFGLEARPLDKLRFAFKGALKTGSTVEKVSWVERDEFGVVVLDAVPWTARRSLTVAGALGAEYAVGRWGFRAGAGNDPSPNPKVTEDLTEQEERVDMRHTSLGLGFRNPFLIFDLGYSYGWGHGDAKEVEYASGAEPGVIQSVTLVPITRVESHSILMTFNFVF